MLPDSLLPAIHAIELRPEDEPDLQRFFEDNPAYFIATTGREASPDAASEPIADFPPDGWTFTRKWVIGYVDERGALVALAHVLTDLLAHSVFHIGTFIVATDLHGKGVAQALYRGLEQWSAGSGAAWMRLGVVRGNVRAERFWASRGYVPVVKTRHPHGAANRDGMEHGETVAGRTARELPCARSARPTGILLIVDRSCRAPASASPRTGRRRGRSTCSTRMHHRPASSPIAIALPDRGRSHPESARAAYPP